MKKPRPKTTGELLPPDGATPLDMVIVEQARPNTPSWETSLARVKARVRTTKRAARRWASGGVPSRGGDGSA
jgi:hypothetical protein